MATATFPCVECGEEQPYGPKRYCDDCWSEEVKDWDDEDEDEDEDDEDEDEAVMV